MKMNRINIDELNKMDEWWKNKENADKQAFELLDKYESWIEDIDDELNPMMDMLFDMKQCLYPSESTTDAVTDLFWIINENLQGLHANIEDAYHRVHMIKHEIKKFHDPEYKEIKNSTFWHSYEKEKSKKDKS
jgi:archaellum component FlaC